MYMVQDLARADNDRIELELQIEQNKLQEDYITRANELHTTMQNRVKICAETYELCSTNRDSLEIANLNLNKINTKITKQNKLWKTATAIITSILVIKLL